MHVIVGALLAFLALGIPFLRGVHLFLHLKGQPPKKPFPFPTLLPGLLPRGVLLVIAHPDDESMFFTPLLSRLRHTGTPAHVLCLTGDMTRRRELLGASRVLGFSVVEIPGGSFAFLDTMAREDPPWDLASAAAVVSQAVAKTGADVIVTFDGSGVSGHRNHIEALGAVTAASRELPVPVLHLLTRSLPSKYLWWAGAGWAETRGDVEVMVAKSGLAVRAMEEHASQWVWYRRLFIHFASYTSFIELVHAPEIPEKNETKTKIS